MSIVNEAGTKVSLNRAGPDGFWEAIVNRKRPNERRWRYLAMLALRENAGWPVERIGLAFGHDRGHVSRCLRKVKDELRAELSMEPSLRIAEDAD